MGAREAAPAEAEVTVAAVSPQVGIWGG